MVSDISTIRQRLYNLIETGEYYDVTFVLKDCRRIHGHKLLFKIASSVFAAMLNGNWMDTDVIKIDDIEYEAFKTVMHFIYTDEINFQSVSHAAKVYKAANKYNILLLEDAAEEFILTNLDISDVCEILEFSKLFNKAEIEEACIMMINFDTLAVLDTVSFLECSFNTLETIVSELNLNIDEIKLFTAVENWAEYYAMKQGLGIEELVPWLSPLLSKIRFLSMSVNEFSKGPIKSKLLNVADRLNLLAKLTGQYNGNLPDGFSNSSQPRKENELQLISSLRRKWKYVQITVRWKKDNISHIEPYTDCCSPPFLLNNFIWRISLKQINLLGKKYLDLNLICDGDRKNCDAEWTCKVNYTFKILAQKNGHQDLISADRSDTFNRENNICGWNPFVLWSTFTNRNIMLIEDDCAAIEIKMTVDD